MIIHVAKRETVFRNNKKCEKRLTLMDGNDKLEKSLLQDGNKMNLEN